MNAPGIFGNDWCQLDRRQNWYVSITPISCIPARQLLFLRPGGSMNTRRGFSLLELLIVVAIILIIATIAIPSLLRSRQSAQESAAVAQLRTINTAEVTYIGTNQGAYGDIASLITQGLLDTRFAGSISGYNFTINV